MDNKEFTTTIPSQWVGPVDVRGLPTNGKNANHSDCESVPLPLATYEQPMWPSVHRGAKVFNHSGGLQTRLISEAMTRSISFHCDSASEAHQSIQQIQDMMPELAAKVASISRFTRLEAMQPQQVGNLIYIRLAYGTGDASGHNMVTLASDQIQALLLQKFPQLNYGSISGNICVDKKNSAINGILGRGRHVIADCLISKKTLRRYLHTSAAKMQRLHIQKNLVGSIVAGSVRSANAHYANMLLAFYLACGQDGANVVEGSQGITHLEERGDNGEDLYFSVSIPNLIVGTVGNGKHLVGSRNVLARMGCLQQQDTGANARRLAMIAAACVACGELSLLAAQTNPGELINAHLRLERNV